jgi:hypothetical protein
MAMDMRRFSGEHFIKVDDVRDGPLQEVIAGVKLGKYDKPDLVFESGDLLSLNATNNKTLVRAYGPNSDDWIGKEVELFHGEIEYQGKMQEAVLGAVDLAATQALSTNEAAESRFRRRNFLRGSMITRRPLSAAGHFSLRTTVKPQVSKGDQPRIARSTVQAVEYLIQKNDHERLRAWLAKLSRAERLAIKQHFERGKCLCRAR